jgi:hypothetical protein
MNIKNVQFIDRHGGIVATAQVTAHGKRFAGDIDLTPMPPDLRQKLDEYEAIVNGQIFSFLDQIEDQIRAWRLRLVEDGCELLYEDLQVYPSLRRVSFQVVARPTQEAAPSSTGQTH